MLRSAALQDTYWITVPRDVYTFAGEVVGRNMTELAQ